MTQRNDLDASPEGELQPQLRVLLVEDDEKLARLTARYLERQGVGVDLALDGETALELARGHGYDAILLDLMLPGLDGLEVCRRLRAGSDVPILMITARGEEADRVLGLEVGADDYIPKPFSSPELYARIRAHVRRARGTFPRRSPVLEIGDLSLDLDRRQATPAGRAVLLTPHEFAVLLALAEHPGKCLAREQLIERTGGGADEAFDRSIDVAISRLRQKLGDDSRSPKMVITVRGAGYLLARPGPR
jgi:two-component system response regulator RstA